MLTETSASAGEHVCDEEAGLRGLIFSIDRCAVEDGPGIRTTVFMKGCPLKCVWCHSPQSQSTSPQLLFYENRCISCGSCTRVCPRNAQMVSNGDRHILWDNCDNCGQCVEVCPSNALEIAGEWMTVEQVMNIVVRDLSYYKNSGGGVTFSGGEPTAQPEFLSSCLKRCKDMGIRTALDTCGFARWSIWREILPNVDLLLYDVKHMDSEKHKQFTGVGNELILQNLKRVSHFGKPIWIRLPLIPGYNDSVENLRQTAQLAASLESVEKVSILGYNTATGAKYHFIGRSYILEHLTPHAEQKARSLVKIFSQSGVKAELSL